MKPRDATVSCRFWNGRGKNRKQIEEIFNRLRGEGHPVLESVTDIQVGGKYAAVVKGGGAKGVFIYLNVGIVARIKLKELSFTPIDSTVVEKLYYSGRILNEVCVTDVTRQNNLLIEASLLPKRNILLNFANLEQDDIVAVRVTKVLDSGLVVSIEDSNLTAFCYNKDLDDNSNDFVKGQNTQKTGLLNRYSIGDCVAARIQKIDPTSRRIWVTFKPSMIPKDFFTVQEKFHNDRATKKHLLCVEKGIEGNAPANQLTTTDLLGVSDLNRDSPPLSKDIHGSLTEDLTTEHACPSDASSACSKDAYENDDELFHYDECVTRVITRLGQGAQDRSEQYKRKRDISSDTFSDIRGALDEAEENKAKNKIINDDNPDGVASSSSNKRKERRLTAACKIKEEIKIRQIEEANTSQETEAASILDFEKLVQSEVDASGVWIRYMAYFLKLKDVEKARETANRALDRINSSQTVERLNVWMAYLNLEATYGTESTLEAVIKRALSYNDPKTIYLQLTYLFQRHGDVKQCLNFCKKSVEKYPESKKMWIRYITCVFELAAVDESEVDVTIRGVLSRGLRRLPKHKQVQLICATARLELKHGSLERGRTYFEKLLEEYPKRIDLWGQYLDAISNAVKQKIVEVPTARSIFKKPIEMKSSFKPRHMKFFFSRWLAFETVFGTDETRNAVIQQAREYVEIVS